MKKTLLTAVLFNFVYLFSPSANAQPGVLDQTFGVGGKVVTNFNGQQLSGQAVLLQPDGKIVVAGTASNNQFAVMRYLSNGSLDSMFGNGGKNLLQVPNNAYYGTGNAADLQPDGKIVLAGLMRLNGTTATPLVLIRYQTNGALDSSFGSNGMVISYVGTYAQVNKVMIKPNGKILVTGAKAASNTFSLALQQFQLNGSIDSTFGINGFANFPAQTRYGYGMALKPNGNILVCGSMPDFGVARVLPTGFLDSTFGNNGIATINLTPLQQNAALALAIQTDDKILLTGNMGPNQNQNVGVARFSPSGSVDSSFGINGKVELAPGSAPGYLNDYVSNIAALPGNSVLVTGTANGLIGDFFSIQLKANGSIDSSYGRRGLVITHLPGIYGNCYGSFVQPDGKLVMVGSVEIDSIGRSIVVRYENNTASKFNVLKGFVFKDNNFNGIKDANEVLLKEVQIVTTKIPVDTLRTMASLGVFAVHLDTGIYTTRAIPDFPYWNITPAIKTNSFTSYFNTDSVFFAAKPITGKRDLSVVVYPFSNARPGALVSYKISSNNHGTDSVTVDTLTFIKSSKLTYNSATSAPAYLNGDTMVWYNVGFVQAIEVHFIVKQTPLVSIGDTLKSVTSISSNKADETPANNTSTINQIVTGSYDPNDKTENHGGRISTAQVANGEYLQYTIRFQNTGNDTAFNVYIRDTLSDKLNWNTLQVITASSDYQATITNGNKCMFTFTNINLVDSIHNEPGSHGYIVYRIKPKANVQLGDVITNRAAIYFDYNLPVLTNTEMTSIVAETFPLHLLSFTARKKGYQNLLSWNTASEVNTDHFQIERSSTGREFNSIGTVKAGRASYTFTDNNPVNGTNYYRLKMLDKDGQFTYGPIRQLTISHSPLTIAIYPNPAKENLQLQIESDKQTTLQMQVITQDGKAVLSKKVTAPQGASLQSINISQLAAGHYFLKVLSAAKEPVVIGFEKTL